MDEAPPAVEFHKTYSTIALEERTCVGSQKTNVNIPRKGCVGVKKILVMCALVYEVPTRNSIFGNDTDKCWHWVYKIVKSSTY